VKSNGHSYEDFRQLTDLSRRAHLYSTDSNVDPGWWHVGRADMRELVAIVDDSACAVAIDAPALNAQKSAIGLAVNLTDIRMHESPLEDSRDKDVATRLPLVFQGNA
jgi:hypothetical protein